MNKQEISEYAHQIENLTKTVLTLGAVQTKVKEVQTAYQIQCRLLQELCNEVEYRLDRTGSTAIPGVGI